MSCRLILYPVFSPGVAENPVSHEELVENLRSMGMIAARSEHLLKNRHLIGEHFLQYISFMGCAPAIELAPGKDESTDYCYLEICPDAGELTFIADEVLANPRCTACKAPIKNWQQQMHDWNYGDLLCCPQCGVNLQPQNLNWRRAAGFVKQYIAIHGIYPKEALPTEALLNRLQTTFSSTWDYFYAR